MLEIVSRFEYPANIIMSGYPSRNCFGGVIINTRLKSRLGEAHLMKIVIESPETLG